MPSPRRQIAERRGRSAEWLALLLLMLKGYRPLARRFKTPFGEIDLIAKRGRLIAFVEVKARVSLDAGAEAVHPAARERIARAASAWLARNPAFADNDMRFDVIAVAPRRWPHHIPGAFTTRNSP